MGKHGYNAPYLFGNFKNFNFYVPDPVIIKIKSLKPSHIRYPGGTLANYHDNLKPGYGYEATQAKEPYLSRMLDLKQRVGCEVIYVANIYNALLDKDNASYWILNMLIALEKLNPTHIELGNEICISGIFMGIADKPGWFESVSSYKNKVFNKACEYLEMCDKFHEAIKNNYPDIKIGIPMQPPFTVRNIEWNRVLRLWGKNDGEVQHIYLTTRNKEATKKEINKVIAGSNKPIWITEWAWVHGNDSTKNLGDVGTPYYNQFFTDFINICDADPRIEITCRHMLYGTSVYCIFKP